MSSPAFTQPLNLPLLATAENCQGGTFIVTGANTGLGMEAARHLVNLGAAKVIMASRNTTAGEEAKAEIEASTGKTGVAEVWQLDLKSYQSVKAFANKAISSLDRIDALIENAAVAPNEPEKAEGHLSAITVNVYSTFLLATLLLPKMASSGRTFAFIPRITIVTSTVSFSSYDDWVKIQDDPFAKLGELAPVMRTYPISKLLEILAVRHLSRLAPISSHGVVINLVCPGVCKTGLSRHAPASFKDQLKKMHDEAGRTPEDGSRTLLHGAFAGKETHGCLLESCESGEKSIPDWVNNDTGKKSQELVWNAIAKELDRVQPGCVDAALVR